MVYESWRDIQKLIGDASKWPVKIRRMLWTQGVKQFQRTLLATFVNVNGLNQEMFIHWARLMGLGRDEFTILSQLWL